jgi:hypothetical protein
VAGDGRNEDETAARSSFTAEQWEDLITNTARIMKYHNDEPLFNEELVRGRGSQKEKTLRTRCSDDHLLLRCIILPNSPNAPT